MVDPVVMELGDVEDVIGGITIGIDNGIRNDLPPDDGKERVLADIGDHHGGDLAAALEMPKTGILPAAPRPRLPLRTPPK